MQHSESKSTLIAGSASEKPAIAGTPDSWASFASSDWWRQIDRVSRSVLMLDYDGTLSPFVRDRMQATLYPGVEERLRRLIAAPRTRVVLISGRAARELWSLLPGNLSVEIWGSHGRERLLPDGRYTATPLTSAQQQCLASLEAELHRRGFASVIEKKIGSLAMHTRGLDDAVAEQITSIGHNFYCTLRDGQCADTSQRPGLEWLPFDGGIELRGAGCSKATAVENILVQELPGTPAAYLGDDLTDEDAFAALRARGPENPTLCVLVRPELRSSLADLWLTPPEELLAFLDRWLDIVTSGGEAP